MFFIGNIHLRIWSELASRTLQSPLGKLHPIGLFVNEILPICPLPADSHKPEDNLYMVGVSIGNPLQFPGEIICLFVPQTANNLYRSVIACETQQSPLGKPPPHGLHVNDNLSICPLHGDFHKPGDTSLGSELACETL